MRQFVLALPQRRKRIDVSSGLEKALRMELEYPATLRVSRARGQSGGSGSHWKEQITNTVYYWLDPTALTITAGRPILAVPKAVESIDAKSVLVAWKDSREARRALRDLTGCRTLP